MELVQRRLRTFLGESHRIPNFILDKPFDVGELFLTALFVLQQPALETDDGILRSPAGDFLRAAIDLWITFVMPFPAVG